ncbi:LAFE_0H17480g1_1 [Lachancea fermentati]|uniref:Transcription factor IIIA n=1 Tax=Lachancea fermentati TaxID=4955 RepID=A0A1G4ML42_LACFM|nr:LAFE_0H17480g1_1 [Lachancea fermentati]
MEEVQDNLTLWEIKGEDQLDSAEILRSESALSMSSLSSLASSSSNRPKTYYCEYDGCDKVFNRPSLLTEHQQAFHQGIRPFKCEQCSRTFVKKSHLERHLFTHSSEKPFHCSYCGKGVTTKQQLKRHEVTHTKSFVCDYEGCGQSFYKHPQLRSHILSVHLQKLTCKHCGRKFQRPYRLENHIAKHHNPDVVNKYQCSYISCSKAFKTWTALQQHIKEDHPKLQCSICGKACVGESGLKMHMTIHDDTKVIKNWKCDLCEEGLSFAKKADLVLHYKNNHDCDLPTHLLEPESALNATITSEPSTSIPSKGQRKKRQTNELNAIETEEALKNHIDSGKSVISLLLNSIGRKFKCPYLGCSRTFKSEERYEKHIDKHKIHELKLKLLKERHVSEVTPEEQDSSAEHLKDGRTNVPGTEVL